MFEKRLRKRNEGIEDFYHFLYDYLRRDNNFHLSSIIQSKSHFFSLHFKNILLGAFKEFDSKCDDHFEDENKVHLDDEDSGINHETLPEIKINSKSGCRGFNAINEIIWEKNPKACLILLLFKIYNKHQTYCADVLGMRKSNNVAQHLKRFLKDREEYLPKSKLYTADGTDDAKALERWLNHDVVLTFGATNKSSPKWIIRMHLPFDCKNPETKYCITECYADDKLVDKGEVKFGESVFPIKNGYTEINLRDFQCALNIKHCSVSLRVKNEELPLGYPMLIPFDDEPKKVIDDDVFLKWKSYDNDKFSEFDFICDFGLPLAYLLNKNLNYQKYGAPEKIDYSLISAKSGEALVVFGSSDVMPNNSPLPSDGFIFPLEWRLNIGYETLHSNLLPKAFFDLAGKISAQFNPNSLGLCLSERFFHDRIDFSKLTLCGGDETSVSSAWLTLSTTLVHAMNNFYKPSASVFASAQCDFENNRLAPIGLVEKKIMTVKEWAAKEFFVCKDQTGTNVADIANIRIHSPDVADATVAAQEIAYYSIHKLKPRADFSLKKHLSEDSRTKRRDLRDKLRALANVVWDKESEKAKAKNGDLRSFVLLSGRPGMGKSLLMFDVWEKLSKNHNVFYFACRAGERNSCINFIRALSWQFAVHSGDFAKALPEKEVAEIQNVEPNITAEKTRELYDTLVYRPLIASCGKNKSIRNYILVDALDEDDSKLIADLLCSPSFKLPQNCAVIVSSRHVEPLYTKLKNMAHAEVDLDSDEYANVCVKDLGIFISGFIYSNDRVRTCWQNSPVPNNDDIIHKKISEKDKSFLYAGYVLQGIAEGIYHFDKLDEELPSGLVGFYNESFSLRFPNPAEYNKVRPLLEILLDIPRIPLTEAQGRLQKKGVVYPVGKLIQMLRGYCVVENGELVLSDASLRDWLSDSIRNPDFAIR